MREGASSTDKYASVSKAMSVAGVVRARRILLRGREQYPDVRERRAIKSNAAIAAPAALRAKKMAGRGTSHKVVIDNYNQRRTS